MYVLTNTRVTKENAKPLDHIPTVESALNILELNLFNTTQVLKSAHPNYFTVCRAMG